MDYRDRMIYNRSHLTLEFTEFIRINAATIITVVS